MGTDGALVKYTMNLVTANRSCSLYWLTQLPDISINVDNNLVHLSAVEYDVELYPKTINTALYLPPSLKSANKKRKAEFIAGRVAAQYSMDKYHEVHNIGVNQDRSPKFPSHFSGSISHSKNLAVSAVVPRDLILDRNVGVDIQHWLSAVEARDVITIVCSELELEKLQPTRLSIEQKVTLIFSAKEALYKAIYPQVKEVLNFDVVELVDVKTNHLVFSPSPSLLKRKAFSPLVCHYKSYENYLVCVAVV
ncbi:4'-phosphopantetheinyl transferase family protein [Vibrio bivalvicida]|uniref:Enterobactin synthase component D n=1 Tax=Vibrio bivalvicida TaxID=1276888 RepID=A0ABV4MN02_9VIBR